MTHNQMRRRRARRARAVDRCLLRYYRQKRIEEEVDRLLLPLDRFAIRPAPIVSERSISLQTPSFSRRPDMRGRWSGLAEEDEIDGNLERIRREDGRVS